MKHTKAVCGHMFAHYDRQADNISNENIDSSRTHLNYNLAVHQQMEQGEFIRQRCSEVKCQNRKDVNVMCSWVLTAPKDLPQGELHQFFKNGYEFLENRYGKENVVSAYVHCDEHQPHMHFAFVPVAEDKKKGGYKVCAKEVTTKQDLKTFHIDLDKHLHKEFGRSLGVLNGSTANGNKTIQELQAEELKAENKRLNAKNKELQAELKKANKKIDVSAQELKEIVTAKAKASEIKKIKNLFGEEVSYNKTMLNSTRNIGNDAYEHYQKANKKLQQVAEREITVAEKEKQVEPLHRQAQVTLRQAEEERSRAEQLRLQQERLILREADRIADERLEKAFKSNSESRTQRLERYCDEITFKDGTSVLDGFLEREKALQIQVRQKNRGFGR